MDLSLALLSALALATTPPADPPAAPAGPTLPGARIPAVALPPLPSLTPAAGPTPLPSARDTVIEYSSAYYQRLTIHRWGSYAMLPLFAAQYYVGSQLYSGNAEGNEDAHAMLAAGVAGVFAVNTVTGVWNLWEGRHDPNDRARRVTHATLMLLADAGFVATGLLAEGAEDGGTGTSGMRTHRAVAIGSMAVSTVGWLMMTDLFRRE